MDKTAFSTLGSAGGMGAAQANKMPVLMDVLDRTRRSRDAAEEIRSRLSELRDRLFGQRPETDPQCGSSERLRQDCFTDTFDATQSELQSTLNSIDLLSSEIASRL